MHDTAAPSLADVETSPPRLDWLQEFLPATMTGLDAVAGLERAERRLLSQIQGRTWVRMLALAMPVAGGDPTQRTMLRRLDAVMAGSMPRGYMFVPGLEMLRQQVRSRCAWAAHALGVHLGLLVQAHGRRHIAPDTAMSPLCQAVFLFHAKAAARHAAHDALRWQHEDAALGRDARDRAVDDFLALLEWLDAALALQAGADARLHARLCGHAPRRTGIHDIEAALHRAYRRQYIAAGVQHPRFFRLLTRLIDHAQGQRVARALAPLLH